MDVEYKDLGNRYFSEKKYNLAIEMYYTAITLNNTNPVYYTNRAISFIRVDKHDEALKDCKRALELEPGFQKALIRGVMSAKVCGEFELAKDYLKKISEDNVVLQEYFKK